jgi:hypothetical protein
LTAAQDRRLSLGIPRPNNARHSDRLLQTRTDQHDRDPSVCSRQCQVSPGPGQHPAARRRRHRRRVRHPVLRRVPLRLAHRPQRVVRLADGLPLRARSRDRRPGNEGGREGHPVQARRPGRGRLHDWLLRPLPQLQGRPGAVLRHRRDGFHLQLGRPVQDGADDLRRLLRTDRGARAVCPARLGQAGPGRDGAVVVRRHHPVLAAQALGGRAGEEGRHRRVGRPRAHGREVCRQRSRTASASGPTPWWCRRTPIR